MGLLGFVSLINWLGLVGPMVLVHLVNMSGLVGLVGLGSQVGLILGIFLLFNLIQKYFQMEILSSVYGDTSIFDGLVLFFKTIQHSVSTG